MTSADVGNLCQAGKHTVTVTVTQTSLNVVFNIQIGINRTGAGTFRYQLFKLTLFYGCQFHHLLIIHIASSFFPRCLFSFSKKSSMYYATFTFLCQFVTALKRMKYRTFPDNICTEKVQICIHRYFLHFCIFTMRSRIHNAVFIVIKIACHTA